ncbi:MAG: glycosyltransferase family 39 protein [Anaerolineae bacterium]
MSRGYIKAHIWLPVTLIGLAFAIRAQNLTYHSFWFDEAMSVHWARSEVSRILQVSMNLVEDRLPPLYYLLLHGWRLVFGDSEMAFRLPSVLLGVLLVAVMYRLVQSLFGRQVALLSSALIALNPFLVWYSQEARMYALAAFVAACATWYFASALRAFEGGRASVLHWIAYSACVVIGLYTHLYTAFSVPAHGMYLLLTQSRFSRIWLYFLGSLIVVALLVSPLALAALRVSGEAGPGDPLEGIAERLWTLLRAFTIWKAALAYPWADVIAAIMGLLAFVGLISIDTPLYGRPKNLGMALPAMRLFIALLLLTPLAVASLLLLRNRLAFFGERYFIVIVPWLLVLIALGATQLGNLVRVQPAMQWRLVRGSCVALPLILSLVPLPGQWSPPARKESWREIAAYLAAYSHSDEAILIHPDWVRYPLQYYLRGGGQTYAVFSSVEAHSDLDAPLLAISMRHPVVWLVESHVELADPQRRVNMWLAERYPLATELYPPGLAVRAYVPGYRASRLPDSAHPISVIFQGCVHLVGYFVPDSQVRATDELFHPPSGWIHVVTYWHRDKPCEQNYIPFVHMVDGAGQVWGASLKRDQSAFHLYPATHWRADEVVRADFDVNLNPVTPLGEYTLVVGLRDSTGEQVPLVDGGSQAMLVRVQVLP